MHCMNEKLRQKKFTLKLFLKRPLKLEISYIISTYECSYVVETYAY